MLRSFRTSTEDRSGRDAHFHPPISSQRTRLHVFSEVFDCDWFEFSPLPIEVILMNLGVVVDHAFDNFDESGFALTLQAREDGTIVIRVIPVGSQEAAWIAVENILNDRKGGSLS